MITTSGIRTVVRGAASSTTEYAMFSTTNQRSCVPFQALRCSKNLFSTRLQICKDSVGRDTNGSQESNTTFLKVDPEGAAAAYNIEIPLSARKNSLVDQRTTHKNLDTWDCPVNFRRSMATQSRLMVNWQAHPSDHWSEALLTEKSETAGR